MAEFNFSEVWNLDNDAELNKAIELIKGMRVEYEKLVSATRKDLAKVSESQKGLNTQIQKTSETFKKSSSTVKDYATQAENLFKQDQELTNQNLRLTTVLTKLQKEQGTVATRARELIKLKDQEVKATQKLNGLSNEQAVRLAKVKEEIREKNKAVKQEAKEALGLITIYDREAKRLNDLRKEYKSVAIQYGINSKEALEYRTELDKLDKKLKDVDKSAGQHQREVGNYALGMDDLQGGIQGVVSKLGVFGIAAGAAALAVGKLAQEVLEMEKRLKEAQNLTGLTGLELEELTSKVKSTSEVFEKDFVEVLTPANALMKTFGLTGEESMNLINEGLARGLDINGEFLDSIKEYSVQFEAAGLGARELVEVIALSNEQGIFSDKGVDSIKEATLRIREMTPATRDAIKGIGLSADEIERGLAEGSKTIFEVIQDVSREMGKLPPQSKLVGTAIADIFGGAGEDAGLQFLLTLQDINTEQGAVNDSLTDYQKRQLEVVAATEKYNDELVQLTGNFKGFASQFDLFIANVKASALGVLNDLFLSFTSLDSVMGNLNKRLLQTNSIEVLEKQLESLNKEIEENKESTFNWIDGLLSFGNVAAIASKRSDRLNKLVSQRDAYIDRINDLKELEEATKGLGEETKELAKGLKTYEELMAMGAKLKPLPPLNISTNQDPKEVLAALEAIWNKRNEFDDLGSIFGEGDEEVFYLDQLDMIAQKEQMTNEQRLRHYKNLQDSLISATGLTEERKVQLYQEYESEITSILEEEAGRRQRIIEDVAFFVSDLLTSATDIFSNISERRVQELEAEREQIELNKEAIESRYEREMELAGDNEEAQELLAQKKEERLMREKEREKEVQREIAMAERQQAIFSKGTAIAQSIINTAVAVTSVLPNIPLAIGIGILGGAQVAAIASEPVPPVPTFATGTDFAPAGDKIVGEEGTEMVVTPSGNLKLTPSRATKVDEREIPMGSKIIPADETKKIVRDMRIVEERAAGKEFFNNQSKASEAIDRKMERNEVLDFVKSHLNKDSKRMDELADKIEERALFDFQVSARGFEMAVTKGGKRNNYIGKKYKR